MFIEFMNLFPRWLKKLSVPQVISRRVSLEQPQETRMLEIRFKSVEAAWRMVTAKVSSSQAYARHDLLIKGKLPKRCRCFAVLNG